MPHFRGGIPPCLTLLPRLLSRRLHCRHVFISDQLIESSQLRAHQTVQFFQLRIPIWAFPLVLPYCPAFLAGACTAGTFSSLISLLKAASSAPIKPSSFFNSAFTCVARSS